LEEIIFENDIISFELAKVLGYVLLKGQVPFSIQHLVVLCPFLLGLVRCRLGA
jgi:hypothetical protein